MATLAGKQLNVLDSSAVKRYFTHSVDFEYEGEKVKIVVETLGKYKRRKIVIL